MSKCEHWDHCDCESCMKECADLMALSDEARGPGTEAGQALLSNPNHRVNGSRIDAILAIEDEARAAVTDECNKRIARAVQAGREQERAAITVGGLDVRGREVGPVINAIQHDWRFTDLPWNGGYRPRGPEAAAAIGTLNRLAAIDRK